MVATHDPRIDASASYRTRIPFRLGCLFLVSISFPVLGELPGGISLALVFMLACAPIWYSAACARDGPVLDESSRKSTAIILFFVAFLILWSFVSVFGSAVPYRAGRYVLSLTAAFVVYFMLLGTLTRERLAIYLDVLCITLAFTSFLSFLGYYEPHLREIVFMGTDRASGFLRIRTSSASPFPPCYRLPWQSSWDSGADARHGACAWACSCSASLRLGQRQT